MHSLRGLLIPFAAALALSSVGCGPDIATLCLDTEDCRGGNEADIEACEASYEYFAELSDIEGCTEEFELYLECFASTAECSTNDTGQSCDSSKDCASFGGSCRDGTCQLKTYGLEDEDDCEAEGNALGRCL